MPSFAGLKAPLYLVPSLKGLGFSNPAYPSASRWAIIFRPAKRDLFRAASNAGFD